MDDEIRWFQVLINENKVEKILERVSRLGFSFSDNQYKDLQGRFVKFVPLNSPEFVYVGIPATDLMDEQEQLEFLLSMLELDEDNVQAV